MKDGDQFDTKKSTGERTHLHEYMNFIAREIQFTVKPIVGSFNAIDKKQVMFGFKNKVTENEAYTGQELCDLLNIDYASIFESKNSRSKRKYELFYKIFS